MKSLQKSSTGHNSSNIWWTVTLKQYAMLHIMVFVCVEVLRPSQPNGVLSSTVSLPNHTFTGQD